MNPRIFTIGVFGSSEDEFFDKIEANRITHFIDVRLRRGMRGPTYKFVNKTYLMNRLKDLGVEYRHLSELAPPMKIRNLQKNADAAQGTAKKDRLELSPAFIESYEIEILGKWDHASFLSSFSPEHALAFFCVEARPSACHRSLIATRLIGLGALLAEHL